MTSFFVSLNVCLQRYRFSQGQNLDGRTVGLFAAHTEFTAVLRKTGLPHPVEPPLSPPQPEGLKPHSKKKPLPKPHDEMESQDEEMTSRWPALPQIMPADTDWIIPYPYVANHYTEIALCQSRYLDSWRKNTSYSMAATADAKSG